jgi:hypothetical protein
MTDHKCSDNFTGIISITFAKNAWKLNPEAAPSDTNGQTCQAYATQNGKELLHFLKERTLTGYEDHDYNDYDYDAYVFEYYGI